ncbi:MAG: DUF4956 domain-containing protein [Gammaproteobacteria bacterium]|jgi:hypothetical protein
MRRSASIAMPVSLITAYYAGWILFGYFVVDSFPDLRPYLPIGGIGDIVREPAEQFEPVYTGIRQTILEPRGAIQLLIACIGTVIIIVPVSWVYFITSRSKEVSSSFVQTIVILPIVVTGIAMIVQNSLALAFSLAGIVAAVRFRFTLDEPADALYIFAAIGIGLGSGIGAVGVATVISIAFVYATLVLWKLEYGKTLSGPFFSMLTRRDRDDEEF